MSDQDDVNLDALKRLWPMAGYGRRGDWYQYVGRQRRQRFGETHLRPDRGPRGVRSDGTRANAISGEVTCG